MFVAVPTTICSGLQRYVDKFDYRGLQDASARARDISSRLRKRATITDRLLHRLEMIQHSRHDRQSITAVLRRLHWLPVKWRINCLHSMYTSIYMKSIVLLLVYLHSMYTSIYMQSMCFYLYTCTQCIYFYLHAVYVLLLVYLHSRYTSIYMQSMCFYLYTCTQCILLFTCSLCASTCIQCILLFTCSLCASTCILALNLYSFLHAVYVLLLVNLHSMYTYIYMQSMCFYLYTCTQCIPLLTQSMFPFACVHHVYFILLYLLSMHASSLLDCLH